MPHTQADKRDGYGAVLFCRAPENLRDLVETVASENLTSASAYVRQAVAMRLRAEGRLPQPNIAAA